MLMLWYRPSVARHGKLKTATLTLNVFSQNIHCRLPDRSCVHACEISKIVTQQALSFSVEFTQHFVSYVL